MLLRLPLLPLLLLLLLVAEVECSGVLIIDSNKTPVRTDTKPNHHAAANRSFQTKYPKIAEQVKFDADDSAVPTTLPDSFIPFKKDAIM